MIRSALLLVLLLGLAVPAEAQITVEGIEISGPEDSLAARRVLDEVSPTSSFWAERHLSNMRLALRDFKRISRVAYPSLDPSAAARRTLPHMESVAAEHPSEGVQAEFLLGALRTAQAFGMEKRAARHYRQLTREHNGSDYAQIAEAFYDPARAIQEGKPVPSFSLASLADAENMYTDESLRGEVYLIDFWGTWCSPCITELPHLQNAYEKYKSEDFTILSVALDDSTEAVRRFREERQPMPWKHAVVEDDSQQEAELRRRFEIHGLPEAILIGDEGKIIATESALRGERLDETLSWVFGENE